MYKINPNSYRSVFVLPTEIADKHLRMAGKAQLKVLLWLFRNQCDINDLGRMSKETGIPSDEIDDSILYWIEAGIIEKDGNASVESHECADLSKENVVKPVSSDFTVNHTETEEKKPEKPPVVKPTVQDIANRISQSEDIRTMFNEIQSLFGRMMGYDGQSTLLMLHDYYGLPVEVITMLCGYAKTIGKHNSLNYIMKMGVDWSENEINTFDRAASKIARLENTDKFWMELSKMIGAENPKPTSKQAEYMELWCNDYKLSLDMIYLAYEKTVEQKGKINLNYMNGILASWHTKGYTAVSEVEDEERRFALEAEARRSKKSSKQKKSDKNDDYTPPSYDYDLAIQQSLMIDPKKTKRGQ